MASFIYNSALYDALTGSINFAADDFKVMIVGSAYVPSKSGHTKRSDVTDEVGASGSYAPGGEAVTVGITNDTVNDRQEISLGSASFTGATITGRRAIYYKSRGGLASADELVACIDFGGEVISTASVWNLTASTLRIENPDG